MKKLLCMSALWVATSCWAYPVPNEFPPFRIAGNLYYVGSDDLASYLVVTPKGDLLINSNLDACVPQIRSSVEKLGFKWRDIKILLISHAHSDHAGGSRDIKQTTGARYYVMSQDVDSIENGGKSDFFYGNDRSMYFPATRVDRELHDGDKVTLGGSVLTAHLTAGHTPGCTTWTLPVTDHGHRYQAVIVGSLNVNPGYQLLNNKRYPNIAQDFQHAFNTMKSLHCDIFLGAHAGYFDLQKKYALLKTTKSNPFVDPIGYQHHLQQKYAEFEKELIKERAEVGVK